MSRPTRIHETATVLSFQPIATTCLMCGQTAWVAYHTQRRITTLQGRFCLSLTVRQCHQEACPRYHHPYRPEEEGRWALPYGEYGLDVIALVGMLRYRHHHSLAELHQALRDRGISIGERTVLNLLARYEELVSIHLANQERLHGILSQQAYVILALDGLRPDVGARACCGSYVIASLEKSCSLVRTSRECEADLAALLTEVKAALPVPIRGVVDFRATLQAPRGRLGFAESSSSTLPLSLPPRSGETSQ